MRVHPSLGNVHPRRKVRWSTVHLVVFAYGLGLLSAFRPLSAFMLGVLFLVTIVSILEKRDRP